MESAARGYPRHSWRNRRDHEYGPPAEWLRASHRDVVAQPLPVLPSLAGAAPGREGNPRARCNELQARLQRLRKGRPGAWRVGAQWDHRDLWTVGTRSGEPNDLESRHWR